MQTTTVVIVLVHSDGSRTQGTVSVQLSHSELNVALMGFYEELEAEPKVSHWEAVISDGTLQLMLYGVDRRASQFTVRAICDQVVRRVKEAL